MLQTGHPGIFLESSKQNYILSSYIKIILYSYCQQNAFFSDFLIHFIRVGLKASLHVTVVAHAAMAGLAGALVGSSLEMKNIKL